MTVVGPFEDYHAISSGVIGREPDGQVICLRSGIDNEAGSQTVVQLRSQSLGISDEILVQIPRVRVQNPHLPGRRLYHFRVPVPDVAHVVYAIEESTPVLIEKGRASTTYKVEWLLVGKTECRRNDSGPPLDNLRGRQVLPLQQIRINAQNQIRIGTQAEPYDAVAGVGDTREPVARVEEVSNNLEVKMRCPAPVLLRAADDPDAIACFDPISNPSTGEIGAAEMSIQRKEGRAAFGFVFQDDNNTVALRLVAHVDQLNAPCQRSENRASCRAKNVDTEMDCPEL
jgi:hypothetical protein